jgi:hypothetical protein
VLSQVNQAAQSFSAGFNANNQFEVDLAGLKITSDKVIPLMTNVHYAYTYDATNQEAKIVINAILDKTNHRILQIMKLLVKF